MTIPQSNIRLGSNIRAEYNPSGSANNVSLSDYYRSLTNESNVNSYRDVPENLDNEFEFPPWSGTLYPPLGNFTNSNYAKTITMYRIRPDNDKGANDPFVGNGFPITRTWRWGTEGTAKDETGAVCLQHTIDTTNTSGANVSFGPAYGSTANVNQDPASSGNLAAFHYNTPKGQNMSNYQWPNDISENFLISESYSIVSTTAAVVLWKYVYALCRVRGAVAYRNTKFNPNVPNLPINSASISFGDFKGGFN